MNPKLSSRNNNPDTPLDLDAASKRVRALDKQGRHQEVLDICLQITRSYPDHPDIAVAWADAAHNAAMIGQWQDAIRYAQTALAHGSKTLVPVDMLAHAHGHLRQWDEARRYGLQALEMRARRFGGEPVIPPPNPLPPMPPLPSPQTRHRNVIAFSLFGGNSRYCEPAVLNVQEQPRIYPHWICRFYVDDSVPTHVIDRLRAGGQVVYVDDAQARWPGPMWRFLALSDPQVNRVLFRDADSVISPREAGAVEQWLTSDKRFHMMRDWSSHTELMLAGLWGAVNGSLPPLDELMRRFMSAPIESQHFADQYFLRQYIWPYARTSLMQHDSVFGFMGAVPFPDGKRPDDGNAFHVGCAEGASFFTETTRQPNGSQVMWELYATETGDDGQPHERLVCAYQSTVQNREVRGYIPAHYARRVGQGTARVRLVNGSTVS